MYETCMNRLDVCSDVVLGEMLKYNYALYQKMREKLGEAWDADGAAELQRIYTEGKKIENRIEEGRIYNQEREKSVLRDIGVLSSLWDDYKEAYENSVVKKYGLKIDALKNLYGKHGETEAKNNAENFFSIKSERSLNGVIALVFNFSSGNDGIYDLQFESISFLNTIIRSFSVLESKVL